jgi:hypothetical protein
MYLNSNLARFRDYIAIVTVLLATVFAPPFIRMLGAQTWTTLGITEGQWSIIMAARGLVFIVFILAARVIGDLWGRRLMLLLSASVPSSLAATVQAIGDATAHLGSAPAYSFMITLLEGFGTRSYIQTRESFGLSQQQIAFRLSTIARASEEFSIVAPGEEQAEILQQIDFWIVQAYTTGLAQAMLVLAAVCLFSAAIV